MLNARPPVNIITVYRVPLASANNIKAFFAELNKIFATKANGVLLDNFNMLKINQFLCSEGKLLGSSTLGHL